MFQSRYIFYYIISISMPLLTTNPLLYILYISQEYSNFHILWSVKLVTVIPISRYFVLILEDSSDSFLNLNLKHVREHIKPLKMCALLLNPSPKILNVWKIWLWVWIWVSAHSFLSSLLVVQTQRDTIKNSIHISNFL